MNPDAPLTSRALREFEERLNGYFARIHARFDSLQGTFDSRFDVLQRQLDDVAARLDRMLLLSGSSRRD